MMATVPETIHTQPPSLRFLPRRLFDPHRPITYLLLAWPLVSLPSLLLSALAMNLAGPEAGPAFDADGVPLFIVLVLFAPMLETLIMGAVLVVLQRVVGTGPAVLLSALGWGLAHSLAAPAWGLVVWWPFLIFSAAFMAWQQRGFWRAWALVSTLHALQNLIPSALVAFQLG